MDIENRFDDELEALLVECDDIVEGFRARYGTHRIGRIEDDPQQMEYEELINLGSSLHSRYEY